MINCPKCGADNMVGAIFCRTCSAKLELDELGPEAFQEKDNKAGKKAAMIAQRLLTVIVFLVLAGILIAMLIPASGSLMGEVDDKAWARTKVEYRRMQKPTRRYYRFSFDSERATALANYAFGLGELGTEEGAGVRNRDGTLIAEHISVEFLTSGTVRGILKCKLLGFLPLYYTAIGTVEATDDGVTFTPTASKIGRMGTFANLDNVVLGQFNSLLSRDPASGVINSIRRLEIEENSIRIMLKVR